jgi:cytochrome P450
VRVNPHELSLNDPFFYEKVYAGGGQKRNKDPYQASSTGLFTATVGTVEHDLHRKRRAYIANFFSKKAITDLEPVVQSKVDTLVQRLKEAHRSGEKLDGVIMFGALAADVVTHYSYGKSFEELKKPRFGQLEHAVKGMLLTFHLRRFFPAVDVVLNRLPMFIMERMNPSVKTYLDFDDTMTQYSNEAIKKSGDAVLSGKGQTLFDALVHPSIPPEEKTLQRLKDESALILVAGLDTTARFLTAAIVYLITYPEVLAKLREELRPLANGKEFKPTWSQLEASPYLVSHTILT